MLDTLFKSAISYPNLNSFKKSLNSSLWKSVRSYDCGKTSLISISCYHTKFFMLCVSPTFVVKVFVPSK